MAILSTLAKILEYKIISMEGEEGTGTLEADIQLLEVSWCLVTAAACSTEAPPAKPGRRQGGLIPA